MRLAYFDTSALVKAFVEEPGSDEVRNLLKGAEMPCASLIAYVEAVSALCRKRRERELSQSEFEEGCESFKRIWEGILIIELGHEIVSLAERLLCTHPLKALDAVHLASALWIKGETGEDVTFITSDKSLASAAREEGLDIVEILERA